MMKPIKSVFIVGPTASGKTDFAINLAKHFNGEIVSADSMQIYKDIPIASACPTKQEKEAVMHHLTEFIELSSSYSVSQYLDDAKTVITDINLRNKIPFVVGGTGLYIDCLANGTEFAYDNDDSVRKNLLDRLNSEPIENLYAELMKIDRESCEKISVNDTKRIIRALEIYYTTGKTKSQIDRDSQNGEKFVEPLYIGLNFSDREKLYERINSRVDRMINDGLLQEAREVLSKTAKNGAAQAIGHKELMPYILGEDTLENCVEKLKMQTRRYAKRQLTWFRKNENINWIYLDKTENPLEYAVNLCNEFLKG
ncbi:MAG: tRNA (adenosine(37)-N6)-dimethylallyltransferase MiaA [Oscillospiraceae bacterium]|nr:tRNA (adenosine(37)-N6)-dimethylallyltransferase MiaA [Candidatus Equicaccousia limihippi]